MPIQKCYPSLLKESSLRKSESRLMRAFSAIARKVQSPALCPNPDEAYALVEQTYGVQRSQADILAVLLSRANWQSPSDQPLEVLGYGRDFLKTTLDALVDRCLLVRPSGLGSGASGHTLDKAFLRSVQEDLPLREAQERVLRDLFDLAVDNPLGLPKEKDVSRMQGGDFPPALCDPDGPGKEMEAKDLDSFLLAVSLVPEGSHIKELDRALERYKGQPFGVQLLRLTGDLSHPEKMVLFYMLQQFRDNFIQPINPSELTGSFERLFSEHVGTLMEKGLVCSTYVWNRENHTSDTEHFRITPEVACLYKGKEAIINKRVVAAIGSFIPPDKIDEKELFFCEEDRVNLDRILQAARPSEYDRIIAALKERKLRPCLSVLMYGPAGTGKTELSLQIARTTGRALLKADSSKLNGIYIGEGEINYRNLFQTYRYICAVSNRAPILFLDEGDGLLGKRVTNVMQASDKDANTVQNVILEELNTLPGIVIVTTNLIGNLDEAMLRRFMIKAYFHLPDEETRAAIWMSKLPSLSRDDAAVLAREFSISPGLIDNIVSMVITDEILYERPFTLDDLLAQCRAQLMSGDTKARKIGFHNC